MTAIRAAALAVAATHEVEPAVAIHARLRRYETH
jgi:hypothetical protein